MKTSTVNTSFKKIALLGALTIAPVLAVTSAAEAAPAFRAPTPARNNIGQNWNNGYNARPNAPRFDQHNQNTPRFDDHRNDNRFDDHRDNGRFDNRYNAPHRNDNKGNNDTAKIIGAGIVGAILGAVLSR